jgi:PAS domain S-box-containing protein
LLSQPTFLDRAIYIAKVYRVLMAMGEADDVTKLNRVEQSQQISERRFGQFFATLPEYCYMISPEGNILDVNPAACEGLGYGKEELVGKPLSALYAPESDARSRVLFEKWKKTGNLRNEEIVILTKQGNKRTVLLNVGSVVDSKGNLLHSTSVQVDITERKRIEQKLRESQERVTAMIASAMDAIITIDSEQRVVMFNASAERMFGCSARDAIGSHINRLIPKRFQRAHEAHVTHFGEAGITARSMGKLGSLWGLRGNGEEFPIEASISQHEIDGRKQFTAIIRDITERVHTESAWRESEERFRLVANAAPVMIWMSGTDKLCMYFNQSWLDFTGRPIEAELGNGWADGVHPKDLEQCMDIYATAFDRREPFQMQYRLRRLDGEYRWILDNGVPRFNADGSFAGYIGSCVDVTERKRAEDALHEMNCALEVQTTALQAREELLKIFVEHVPAGVAMFDRDMRYLQASDRWCADYGIDRSQVLGKSHYELFPNLPDRWREVHRRGLAGETVRAEEDRWDRETDTKWIRWEVRPWWSRADSLPGGILIFAEDVTRRKEVEEALRAASQKLIKAQEDERTRIARELHDDINQRIALLAVRLQSQQSPHASAAEFRKVIGDTITELENLGMDVQALSHKLHSSKLESLGLATAAASFCKELSSQHGVEIEFHSENIPTDLSKDISLNLFRVLQEALQNAIKYSGSRRFHVSLTGTSNQVQLKVRDTGIGFDPEEAMKGHGLGLTSMKERVKMVNGTLSIDSQPLCGTTIQARVPFSSQTNSAGAVG